MKYLVILCAFPLTSCFSWGSNCGQAYLDNYSEFVSGDYDYVEGDRPDWLVDDTLRLQVDKEAQTVALSSGSVTSVYSYRP